MKSGWFERSISVVLDLFEVVLVGIQFPCVSANIWMQEISLNFKKIWKILKLASDKFYCQRHVYARIIVGFT